VCLAIGGDPGNLSAEVTQHLVTCPQCARFRDETLAMEDRLKAALELPLHRFRKPAEKSVPRRYALAASLLVGLLLGGGAWLLRPSTALADEIVAHIRHEAGSWALQKRLSPAEISAVLGKAGVHFDTTMPVVYASPCPFRGHVAPHLVVQTSRGPITVMLLAHEKLAARQQFSEDGYQGVLLPAGEGSVAVLSRGGATAEADLDAVLSAVRW
jgi:hypothetical protein